MNDITPYPANSLCLYPYCEYTLNLDSALL